MKITKRLAAVALAATMTFSLNVFTGGGVNNSLIAEATNYSDEVKYDDYLSYRQVDEDEDGTYDYVEIFSCDETAKEVIIPAEIEGLPVTTIGFMAFANCGNLTSVEIPNSVTSIDDYAFALCKSLISVEIPDSVTSIGEGAFCGCCSLTSVVEMPDGVTTIGYGAFDGCSGLTGINASENNENYSSIGGVLFNKTQTELIIYPAGKKGENYSVPNSVTTMGSSAFSGCNLRSIEIPNSVMSIGSFAFNKCSSLESITILNPDCDIYDYESTICNGYDDNYYFNGTILGYDYSTAQKYALNHDYKFESLGENPFATYEKGDANNDGKVSIADARFIAQMLASKKQAEIPLWADFNDDGKVNIKDARDIAVYLAHKKFE